MIVAEHNELFNNKKPGKAAVDLGITHFERWSGSPFEIASEAPGRGFTTNLNSP